MTETISVSADPKPPLAAGGESPIRLAQVVTRLDVGGVPEHVLTLVEGLSHRGYDITVVCRDIIDAHAQRLSAANVKTAKVDLSRLPSPLADFRSFRHLIRLYRESEFDIVHTHMSKAAMLGCLAARFARVPAVVNTAHNLGFLAFQNRLLRGVFRIYDKLLGAIAMDTMITVSAYVRDAVISRRVASASRVRAIRNGVDPHKLLSQARSRADVRAEFDFEDTDVVVLVVARLVWFKGLDVLLKAVEIAARDVPNLHVLVVGEGPLRDELEQQASDLGIAGMVRFIGERDDVPSLIMGCDLFALSSVSEGLPISILEAMAFSKPVIATSVGGIPELVIDGETGILAPCGDHKQFGAGITCLASDLDLRLEFGRAGRARLDREFSVEQMVVGTDRLYRELLSKRGRRST